MDVNEPLKRFDERAFQCQLIRLMRFIGDSDARLQCS